MKVSLGTRNCLYPALTVLVGANVNGQPNYVTTAHVGIMDLGSIAIGLGKGHYTNGGIRENGTFSINIPGTVQLKEVDRCGIVSGRQENKAGLFQTFYGLTRTAPMILECPVNMECKVIQTLDLLGYDIFVGHIVDTRCDESVMTNGAMDPSKLDPILFSMEGKSYWSLGDMIGTPWREGRQVR